MTSLSQTLDLIGSDYWTETRKHVIPLQNCTAPGLCSGWDPEITWTWRGHLTSVTRRHSSTLTFNPSAEHHGTDVTCKVRFTNDITTEETETLNVTLCEQQYDRGSKHFKVCVCVFYFSHHHMAAAGDSHSIPSSAH
uniref:Ig-like domain-containing protein n=1 Tax=Gasterosteus aculeatus aculeatus TaxID=481459 RepID=A0AAQ4QJH0_GASAC